MVNSALQKKFSVRLSYTVSAFPGDYVEMLLSRPHKDSYNCETPQKNWATRWNHVVSGYTRISNPSRDGRFATKTYKVISLTVVWLNDDAKRPNTPDDLQRHFSSLGKAPSNYDQYARMYACAASLFVVVS